MAIPVSRRQHEPARALAPSEFLKELSAELASGDIRLPSFPDACRRMLSTTARQIKSLHSALAA